MVFMLNFCKYFYTNNYFDVFANNHATSDNASRFPIP